MSLTMTWIDDEGKTKAYGVTEAMDIANVVGFENFEECTGSDFGDAAENGLVMTANQRKVCLHGLRQLQQRNLVSDNAVNAVLNILMNGGEEVVNQPVERLGGPMGGLSKGGPA